MRLQGSFSVICLWSLLLTKSVNSSAIPRNYHDTVTLTADIATILPISHVDAKLCELIADLVGV